MGGGLLGSAQRKFVRENPLEGYSSEGKVVPIGDFDS